jgi:hypothetical protein
MSNPDGEPNPKAADTVSEEPAASSLTHADNSDVLQFHDDIQAGQILAEMLGGGPAEAFAALDDVHAVLAAVPDETFESLDDAVHHLTSSVDLFDVPIFHDNDGSGQSA